MNNNVIMKKKQCSNDNEKIHKKYKLLKRYSMMKKSDRLLTDKFRDLNITFTKTLTQLFRS